VFSETQDWKHIVPRKRGPEIRPLTTQALLKVNETKLKLQLGKLRLESSKLRLVQPQLRLLTHRTRYTPA
jgi:hypothetical protein